MRDDLTTAWQISETEHTSKKWIEPRRSTLRFRHAMDDGKLVGFEAYWKEEEEPLWKESIRGPFSHGTMPNGAGNLGKEVRCFELFALRHGEKLFVGKSTCGLVRAEMIPRDVLTGHDIGGVGGADGTGKPRTQLIRWATQWLGENRSR